MGADVAARAEAPRVDFDPFDLESLRDPHAAQAQLRDLGPVLWIEKYGTYGVARYEEVSAVLRNWEQFSSAGGAGMADIRKPGAWRDPGPIVDTDPPHHTSVRSTMNRILSPRVIRGWRETFESAAEALCDEVLKEDLFDAVSDLTEAYVLKVFPEALGLKVIRENLLVIGNHNFNAIGPQNVLFRQTEAALDVIAEWFAKSQQQESLIPGGFGELIFEAEAAGDLPAGVAPAMMKTLMRGGMDTTIAGLGNALWLLAEHSDQWATIKANPLLVRDAFEEALRLESPIQSYFRTTSGRVELSGLVLEPDTKIQLFIGAANRDPRRWSDPDRFDVARKPIGQLAFGAGIHVCVGQMIARLEAECLLTAFVRRVSRMQVVGEARHRLNNTLRTPDTLPLRIERT